MKCSLCISNFLEKISNLSHSIVFLFFFSLIAEEGFLISPCSSFELCIQMGIFSLLSLYKLENTFLCSFSNHYKNNIMRSVGEYCISSSCKWYFLRSGQLKKVCEVKLLAPRFTIKPCLLEGEHTQWHFKILYY